MVLLTRELFEHLCDRVGAGHFELTNEARYDKAGLDEEIGQPTRCAVEDSLLEPD